MELPQGKGLESTYLAHGRVPGRLSEFSLHLNAASCRTRCCFLESGSLSFTCKFEASCTRFSMRRVSRLSASGPSACAQRVFGRDAQVNGIPCQ